ncbi:MAG: biopolymer transporter ExbD [Verrucomicrobiota bacterium JB023]|nr:biopolymer transporter ExbD [Verrucomicrobiota bacterium JB023]
MARHSKAQNLEEDEPGLDISSLIDICFLLLIYFLVTSTIQPREQDVDMSLPAAAPSEEPPPIKPTFIRVDSTGTIYMNTGPSQETLDTDTEDRKVPLLNARLQEINGIASASGEKPMVQIYVEDNAIHQRVIDVLNALKKNEISRVTFTDLVN